MGISTGIAVKLEPRGGLIVDMLASPSLLENNIQEYINKRMAAGAQDVTPPPSFISMSHYFALARNLRPYVTIANEWLSSCGCCSTGWGGKVTFDVKQSADYLANMYVTYMTPEVRATEAPLPPIIVRPANQDVFAANNQLATNFGTGALATVAQTNNNVSVRDGFSYQFDGAGGVEPVTVYEHGNRTLNIRSAATDVDGIGGISYTYVDAHGQFIAGPDGTAVQPTNNGFGGGDVTDEPVNVANYVAAADLFGIKAFEHYEFSVDNDKIEEYPREHVLNVRRYRMDPSKQKETFDRLIGQEIPFESISQNFSGFEGVSHTGGDEGLSGRFNKREVKQYVGGFQTPAAVQAPRRIVMPLMFDHNLGLEKALPVATFPDSDICYSINLAQLRDLYKPAFGSVFIRESVEFYNQDNDDEGILSKPKFHIQRIIPFLIPGSVIQTDVDCKFNASLIIEHIYLNELLHLCLISRIQFYPFRSNKLFRVNVKNDEENKRELPGNKFPITHMIINDYSSRTLDELNNPDAGTDWHKLGHIIKTPAHKYFTHLRKKVVGGNVDYVLESVMTEHNLIDEQEPILQNLGVDLHGTEWFDKLDRFFYEKFTPLAYGHDEWFRDKKDGLHGLLVNFGYAPGCDQITGLAPVNSNRKLELTFDSQIFPSRSNLRDGIIQAGSREDDLTKYQKVVLHIISEVMNFIYIAGAKITVRFH